MDILEQGKEIMENRSSSYGPSDETNQRCADIASIMVQKKFTIDDVYAIQIALKLSRESFTHKEDNMLDGVCYMKLWNDHRNLPKTHELKIEVKGFKIEKND